MDGPCLLGAPIIRGIALDATLEDHCRVLSRALKRLIKLPSQNALILLRSSFGATKLSYLLRCSPCLGHQSLEIYDELLRQGLQSIVNCPMSDYQWLQATLPINKGGSASVGSHRWHLLPTWLQPRRPSDCRLAFWLQKEHHQTTSWTSSWNSVRTPYQ